LNFFTCRVQDKNKYKVAACLFENNTNLKRKILKAAFNFFSVFSSQHIGRLSPLYIHGQLSEQFSLSQADFALQLLESHAATGMPKKDP
jgi:hypothetical protein